MTLVEFLLARIAEDETRARRAGGQKWLAGYNRDSRDQIVAQPADDAVFDWELGSTVLIGRPEKVGEVVHAAAMSPARVLAECEAKRRIVELHAVVTTKPFESLPEEMACETCGSYGEYPVDWPCTTLRLLALPYADHPDYDEAWRP